MWVNLSVISNYDIEYFVDDIFEFFHNISALLIFSFRSLKDKNMKPIIDFVKINKVGQRVFFFIYISIIWKQNN